MKLFISSSIDPYINIATEELLLKDNSLTDDIIFIWQNHNTIFFGRNQNIHEEINSEYVKANSISLVRRLSGGGAVFHDEGNVNFTFITKKETNSYQKFLEPIIEFLQSLGLNAQFKGKNDLEIDNFKVSGNAQYIFGNRMFHHGTLLFDTDLTRLSMALKPNKLKLESKGIKSTISRVSNIKNLLSYPMTTSEFKNKLIDFFISKGSSVNSLDTYKLDEIKELAKIKKSDEWNYGQNPSFNIVNEKRFDGGTIKVLINTNQNKIIHILIVGDFLSKNDFENIYLKFLNQDFSEDNIKNIVYSIENFDDYFGLVTKDELISLMIGK